MLKISRRTLFAALGTLALVLPQAMPPAQLEAALRGAVGPLGLELTLGPIQAEVL